MKTEQLLESFFLRPLIMSTVNNWISTVFRVGYLPFAPGTWCSIIAFLVWYYFMGSISPVGLFGLSLIIVVLGIVSSNSTIEMSGKPDPPEVVIDELAGQWFALIALPHTLGYGIAALIGFRILDIFKPPPIKQLEHLPGGWGVMMDDVAAGIITCLIINGYRLYL